MRSFPSKSGGYSLIELVIYLAIFIGISVVIIHSLVSIMRTYATAESYRRLQNNGELAMERIVREVRQANSITAGASTFDTSPGTLSIASTDEDSVNHIIVFDVADGALRMTDNADSGNLTSSEVVVSSLLFRNISTAGGGGVKIELVLSTANGHSASAPFYSTVMLRGNE